MIYQKIPANVFAGDSVDYYTNTEDYLVLYWQTSNEDAMKNNLLWFFVDDAKFWSTWYKQFQFVQRLQKISPVACLMPNYSIWGDDPMPEQMYNWYKSLVISRIWQEMWIKIAPVINWWPKESYKFVCEWIPKWLGVVWTQCRNIRIWEEWYFIDWLKFLKEVLQFQKVVIYWWYENPALMELCEQSIEWLEIIPFMSWNSKKRLIEKERTDPVTWRVHRKPNLQLNF